MTLILLAVSLTIVICVIAYNLAIYALPVLVAISAAQYAWGAGAGVLLSSIAAAAAALLSTVLVIAVVGFARNPVLRLAALSLFAVPAATAGYALVHGITRNMLDPGFGLMLLCGGGGLFIGIAAMVNLNALGEAVFSR
ncbi:hypothetical protein DFO80_14913 [Rhodobacter sp. 140A]|uniref:Uncharacterized protein n=1 Tax=Paenirhodobacter hankyongi TaxID=2294033 RepID=A0A421BK33_9RHOB|nr:hypothetical protein [Sinirhodobacter hankyongi]RBP78319.1 hypothetical protein DFO80_14913 [Rhodobacter sp. 140A]RLL62889.1 hypothetical protein DYS74_15555 [Sinirhodobacter hankyongi]